MSTYQNRNAWLLEIQEFDDYYFLSSSVLWGSLRYLLGIPCDFSRHPL